MSLGVGGFREPRTLRMKGSAAEAVAAASAGEGEDMVGRVWRGDRPSAGRTVTTVDVSR